MPETKKAKQIKSNNSVGYDACHSIPCIATIKTIILRYHYGGLFSIERWSIQVCKPGTSALFSCNDRYLSHLVEELAVASWRSRQIDCRSSSPADSAISSSDSMDDFIVGDVHGFIA
ncbi:MAG: hypothetical protein KQH59_06845 [Desulfobulbaceae bacterium]|nr:hypothetical protein [Desulfobulbaceae bacterium]